MITDNMTPEQQRAATLNEFVASTYTVLALYHGLLAHIPGTDDRHLEYSIICIIAILYYIIVARIY